MADMNQASLDAIAAMLEGALGGIETLRSTGQFADYSASVTFVRDFELSLIDDSASPEVRSVVHNLLMVTMVLSSQVSALTQISDQVPSLTPMEAAHGVLALVRAQYPSD